MPDPISRDVAVPDFGNLSHIFRIDVDGFEINNRILNITYQKKINKIIGININLPPSIRNKYLEISSLRICTSVR